MTPANRKVNMGTIQRPRQLVLIRHAESLRNQVKKDSIYFPDDEARREVRGIPDYKIPLTERGLIQARMTGVSLFTEFGAPDYAYHSGYLRTEQTLDAILEAATPAERKSVNVRMNQFVRERDAGYSYDMTTEEAETAFPWLREHWKTFGGFFSRPPGGESVSDVSQRIYAFLNALFRDRAGKKVWVVTHGIALRAFRFVLERWTYNQAFKWPEGQSPENCGVTVYNFDESQQRLMLSQYNSVYWR